MNVSEVTTADIKHLRYRYDVGTDMSFDYTLLCEVGLPYQNAAVRARNLLAKDREIIQVDLPCAPWYADAFGAKV